jgi:hypothetical protein
MSETTITTGRKTRLLLREYQAGSGAVLLTIAPQYEDRAGEWRLSHSGLILAPDVARELAPALLHMAATIDDLSPPEPQPTEADRDSSRWP